MIPLGVIKSVKALFLEVKHQNYINTRDSVSKKVTFWTACKLMPKDFGNFI